MQIRQELVSKTKQYVWAGKTRNVLKRKPYVWRLCNEIGLMRQEHVLKAKTISVATSEVWGAPTFWLWDDVGQGTDIDSTVALQALEYWLEFSPQRHPERITELGNGIRSGHITQYGEKFCFIRLDEDVSFEDETVSVDESLFCIRHDLPPQATLGSRVQFCLFRWKDKDLLPGPQQKNAGKLGALNIRLL